MEYKIVASRGRWKDDRWVQQYEVNDDQTTNTLTGVQKDNLVLEIDDADQQTYSGGVDA